MAKSLLMRILSAIMAFFVIFTQGGPAMSELADVLRDLPEHHENFTTANGTAITIVEKIGGKDVVVGRLTASGIEWEKNLDVDKDYYLSVSLPKSLGGKFLQVSTGDLQGIINGVAYVNMPGQHVNGIAVEELDAASALSRIVYVNDYTIDPSKSTKPDVYYGSNNTAYKIINGDVIYQISISADADESSTINFQLGFHIDPNLYDNSAVLSDALLLRVGDYDPSTGDFDPVPGYTQDLDVPLNQRTPNAPCIYGSAVTAALDMNSAPVQARIDNITSVQMWYEKLEMDMRVPVGAEITNLGFDNTDYSKTHGTYGVITYTGPKVDAETNENVYHVVISGGLKSMGASPNIYYTVKPTSPTFKPGDVFQTHYTDVVATLSNNGTYQYADSTFLNITVVDANADATKLSSNNRTVYNSTIDTDDPYKILLGRGQVMNVSLSPTPFDKIFEADYNVNNADAVITTITVPYGDRKDPEIVVTGYDADHNLVSVTVENPDKHLIWYSTKNNFGYHIEAEDIGLTEIKSVKADIGKLVGDEFYTEPWNVYPYYEGNVGGCWGYFTTDAAGIVVRTDYHLYNKQPEYRSFKNGDLTSRSLYTSTDKKIAAAQIHSNLRVENVNTGKSVTVSSSSSDTAPAIAPGESVKLSSNIYLSSYNFSNYKTMNQQIVSKTVDDMQTVQYLADPVFYLTLPAGFRLEGLTFNQQSRKVAYNLPSYAPGTNDYGNTNWKVIKSNLEYSLEDISYMNKTGDDATIYKISFNDDVSTGYFAEDGTMRAIGFSVQIGTSKGNATKRYPLSTLMQFSAENPLEGAIYGTTSTLSAYCYTVPDKYGINGGNDLDGVTCGSSDPNSAWGFSLQKVSDVIANNEITVTKVNKQPVADTWHTYLAGDPNSIALMGAKSEGQYKATIHNSDQEHVVKNVTMVVPIPKKDVDLGTAFMNGPMQYSMNFTFDAKQFASQGFTAKYIQVQKTSADNLLAGFKYTESTQEEANAILLEAAVLGKGATAELYFDYTSGDDAYAGDINIFHNALTYVDLTDSVMSRTGSNVAVEIAEGTITGTVYHDENRNATMDEGEVGIPGINVRVVDQYGRIQFMDTDENGQYAFHAVRESDIRVYFTAEKSCEYRFNVPVGGVTIAKTNLTANKSYETLVSEVMDMPMDTFVTLSYNANPPAGLTATGNLPKESEHVVGSTAKVSAKPDNLAVIANKFLSWNTMPDGSGTSYAPNETFTIHENTVLYAQWEKMKYTITLDYQGGTPAKIDMDWFKTLDNDTFPKKKQEVIDALEAGGHAYDDLITIEYDIPYQGAASKNYRDELYRYYGLTKSFCEGSEEAHWFYLYLPASKIIANDSQAAFYLNYFPTTKNGYEAIYDLRTGQVSSPWYFLNSSKKESAFTVYSGFNTSNLNLFDENNNLTVYLRWTPKTDFTVKYDSQGGTEFADNTGVSWEQNVYELARKNVPTKVGYTFLHWEYDGAQLPTSSLYGALAVEDTVKEITLKAVYSEKNYTVHYDAAGGTPVDSRVVRFTQDNMNALTSTKKDGYVFEGWSVDGTEDTIITPEQTYSDLVGENRATYETTLTAVWKLADGFTVLFDSNGGTAVADKSGLEFNATGLLKNTTTVRKGYDFAGWTYIVNGEPVSNDTAYSDIVNDDESIRVITLLANWTGKTYRVEYTNVVTPIEPQTGVLWEQNHLLPDATPEKQGYKFTGWTFEDAAVKQTDSVSALIPADDRTTLVMVANWDLLLNYTVEYISNGGSTVMPKTGLSVVSDNLLPGSVTRSGYSLEGWYTDAALTQKATNATTVGEFVPAGEYVAKLYAKWEAKKGFTVKYNLAGGKAANGDAEIPDKSVAWTDAGLTPAEDPIRSGYTFTGWMYGTKAVSSETTFDYLAITEDKNPLTLVATWQKADVVNYSSTAYYTQMSYNEPWNMDFYALLMDENRQIMNITYGYSAYLVSSDTQPSLETMLQNPVSGVDVARLSADQTKYTQYNYIHFSVKDIAMADSKKPMWIMFAVESTEDGATSTYYSSIKRRSLYDLATTVANSAADEAVIGNAVAGYADAFEQYNGSDFVPTVIAPTPMKASLLKNVTTGTSTGLDMTDISISAAQPDSMVFTSSMRVDNSWRDYGMILLEDRFLTGSDDDVYYCCTESHLDGDITCSKPHATVENLVNENSAILYSKKTGNIDTDSEFIRAVYADRTYIYQLNTPLHYAFFYEDSDGVYHFSDVGLCVPYLLLNEIAVAGGGNEAELAKAALGLFRVIYSYQTNVEFIWE